MNVCHHAVGTMVQLVPAPWYGQHNVVLHINLHNVVERIVQTVILGHLRKLWIDLSQIQKLVRRQWSHWGLNVIFFHITSCSRHCTQISRQLNTTHLQRCWNHQRYGHAWIMCHDISEIPFISLLEIYPPKPILYTPFYLKNWHIPVLRRRQESNALVNSQYYQMQLPETSDRYYYWKKGRVRVVWGATQMKISGFIEMPWICGVLWKLAKL